MSSSVQCVLELVFSFTWQASSHRSRVLYLTLLSFELRKHCSIPYLRQMLPLQSPCWHTWTFLHCHCQAKELQQDLSSSIALCHVVLLGVRLRTQGGPPVAVAHIRAVLYKWIMSGKMVENKRPAPPCTSGCGTGE